MKIDKSQLSKRVIKKLARRGIQVQRYNRQEVSVQVKLFTDTADDLITTLYDLANKHTNGDLSKLYVYSELVEEDNYIGKDSTYDRMYAEYETIETDEDAAERVIEEYGSIRK